MKMIILKPWRKNIALKDFPTNLTKQWKLKLRPLHRILAEEVFPELIELWFLIYLIF